MRLRSPPANESLSTDELRRNIEVLRSDAREAMSYYERRMAGV
jgi:hypothetical protein